MPAKIGFLTVRRNEELGYVGGYLIVNHLARPLEFQCSLPIQPSRTQNVLYGPTLEDFICGEQIGQALLSKAKLVPDLILADSLATLSTSLVLDLPIAMLRLESEPSENAPLLTLPQKSALQTSSFTLHNYHFQVPVDRDELHVAIERVLKSMGESFDVREPFQRIANALSEAIPGSKAA